MQFKLKSYCFFFLFLFFLSCKKGEIENQTNTLEPTVNSDTAITMYVSGGYTKKLFALNASNGNIKWEANLGGYVLSSPVYGNGMIFVGCTDNKLYAFDTTGNLKWTANTSTIHIECPIVFNDVVYFPDDKSVTAYNAKTGIVIWKFLGGGNNVVLKNGIIYTNNYYLSAIDALTGVRKWQYFTKSTVPPIVYNDKVFGSVSIGYSDSLCIFSTSTGNLLSSKSISSPIYKLIGLNIKHGNIYCVLDNGLNVFDSATLTMKFQKILDVYAVFSDGISPLFSDSLIFIPTRSTIRSLNAFNGLEQFEISSTFNGLTIVDNLLYYTQTHQAIGNPYTGSGYFGSLMNVYNCKTRQLKWSKPFKDVYFIYATPCVVTKSGKVYRGGLIS